MHAIVHSSFTQWTASVLVAQVIAAEAEAAAEEAREAAEEEAAEEEALRQAMLMSEETEDALQLLSITELKSRCTGRGISTLGLAEKQDLVNALLGTDAAADGATVGSALPNQATSPSSGPQQSRGAEVLAAFREPFWCQTITAEEYPALDAHGGKVVLPHSCLQAIAMILGGDLPSTILLRLTFRESSVFAGVADFVPDAKCLQWLRPRDELPPSGLPTWGPGALAAVFLPRWIQQQLACSDGARVQLALVSLPKATGIVLQPQTEGFALAVQAFGDDVRETLTPLFNRLTAVARGDVLSMDIGGARHAVEVLAVRGLPDVRCGRPAAVLDVGAALRAVGAGDGPSPPILLPAACIVDADVEVDFAESSEAEGASERARAAAVQAEAERRRLADLAAAEAAAAADPWSAKNVGEGCVLGSTDGDAPRESDGGASVMSDREKRLAALERRGLS